MNTKLSSMHPNIIPYPNYHSCLLQRFRVETPQVTSILSQRPKSVPGTQYFVFLFHFYLKIQVRTRLLQSTDRESSESTATTAEKCTIPHYLRFIFILYLSSPFMHRIVVSIDRILGPLNEFYIEIPGNLGLTVPSRTTSFFPLDTAKTQNNIWLLRIFLIHKIK